MQVLRQRFILHHKLWKDWLFSKNYCSQSLVPLSEVIEKKNFLFMEEQKRQYQEVGRIEKIKVEVCGPLEDKVLVMNQNVSTPYDCCKHISEALCQRYPLAVLNDKVLWDMHSPLPGNCKLKFLSFRDKDPFALNEVFWRTGSFVLGAVIMKAFKEEFKVKLHSFPYPVVASGSFVYDVQMSLNLWDPTENELKILSGELLNFVMQNHKIEKLRVKKSVALPMFEENEFKQNEVKRAAAKSEDKLVTLYRVGEHIDISEGPMLANTSFFGRCSVASVYYFEMADCEGDFYRFQAVALPKGIMLNSYAFEVLVKRALKLNEADLPGVPPELQPNRANSWVGINKNSEIPMSPYLRSTDM